MSVDDEKCSALGEAGVVVGVQKQHVEGSSARARTRGPVTVLDLRPRGIFFLRGLIYPVYSRRGILITKSSGMYVYEVHRSIRSV